MNSPEKISQCKKALEELIGQYQRKEYAKAISSAAYLKALAGEVERWVHIEHGGKRG